MTCDLLILFSYWCFTPSSARAMELCSRNLRHLALELTKPLGTAGLRP